MTSFPSIFTETPPDTPGPSRLTCIPPAWISATSVSSNTTLSTSEHDERIRMKARWRGFESRRNRIIERAARALHMARRGNQSPVFIAPHHHQCFVTLSLTSTLDVNLTYDSCDRDIWPTTGEESVTPSDAAYHQDTLELRSGQLNNGSQFDNFDLDRSSCTPSYLGVCAAEQSTRVRDEVSKRPEALVFGVFEDGQEVPPSQDDVLHDMIALNSPQHPEVTVPSPSLLFGSVSTSGYQDFSPYNNSPSEKHLLRALRANKHNLILDSPNPTLIPHIVITPPEVPYDGLAAFIQNGVEYQDLAYLWVPARAEGYGSICIQSPLDLYQAWPTAQIDVGAKAPLPWYIPPSQFSNVIEQAPPSDGLHVFSPSEFGEEIESASTERLIMYHVIPALHRNLFKVVALQASRIAAEFRRNWDSPEFVASLEQPFQWRDPAEFLLSYHRNQPRSLILDSTQPFSVPHIIIEEAERQPPSVAFANCIPSPQDRRFGQMLAVPQRWVAIINDPDDYDEEFAGEVIYAGTPDNSVPELSPDSSSSESESPTSPSTPLDTSWLNGSLFSDEVECKDRHSPLYDEPQDYRHSVSEYALDEDEDELPPFDDWYTDTIRRSAM